MFWEIQILIFIMPKTKRAINFDISKKTRSFQIILKRENFDAYRQKENQNHIPFVDSVLVAPSECKIILSKCDGKLGKAMSVYFGQFIYYSF